MTKLILLALVAGAAGCASTPTVWYKADAKPGEFAQAKYDCLRSNTVAGYDSNTGRASSTNYDLFQPCMEAKGWALRAAR